MLEAAGEALDGSTEVRTALVNLAKAAKKLQALMKNGSEVHCLVSCPLSPNECQTTHKFEFFTIVSSLFHKALRSDDVQRKFTAQTLSESFFIANQAKARREANATDNSVSARTRTEYVNKTANYSVLSSSTRE